MSAERLQFLREILWPLIRDVLLFLVGLAGVIHEVLTSGVERPAILGILAAMMGLPAVLRIDRKGSQ